MVNNFSVDQESLYINWANTSLCIILGKFPTLNLPIKSHPSLGQLFFQMQFYCQITTLFDRYYLLNCSSIKYYIIPFINYTKYKQPNIPNPLHIFLLKLDKASHSFLNPFHLRENQFSKNSAWSFEQGGGALVKMYRLNAFRRTMNTIN